MTADAASSWAVYIPQDDALGRSNSDGREVDFYSEDGSHRTYTWAYLYDATTKHVTRYSRLNGSASVADEDLGAFDSFAATSVAASALGSADPLFAASTIPTISYGYDSNSEATGGNGFVRISVVAHGVNRNEMLASGTVPTTFTVVVNYTPSPAPVATSTPTPLVVAVGTTLTPPPTPTPIACCTSPPVTPTPTATMTESPTPTPSATTCASPCGNTITQTFNDLTFIQNISHHMSEWAWATWDGATNACLSTGSNLQGENLVPAQPACGPHLGVAGWGGTENVAVITSNSYPTVTPIAYTYLGGLVSVGVSFTNIGGNQWQETLGMSGGASDKYSINVKDRFSPTFTITTN